jgi:hypothetical protein
MIREIASTEVLYHGTNPKNVAEISKLGLRPSSELKKVNFDESISRNKKVFAARTPEIALHWALKTWSGGYQYHKNVMSTLVAIVRFRADSSRVKKDRLGGMSSVQVDGAVPVRDLIALTVRTVRQYLEDMDVENMPYELSTLKKAL